MQVYILLIDDSKAIIPKKAEKNNLWQGQQSTRPVIVNQAGQYALFGGRVEHGEDIKIAAIREVIEESGVDIGQYNHKVSKLLETVNYTCLMYTFSGEDFQKIHERIADNLRTRNIYDGEMQSIVVTNLSNVNRYLGVRQPVSQDVQAEINNTIRRSPKYKYNHAIDWYGEIGTECTKRSVSTPSKKKQSISRRLAAGRQRKLEEELGLSRVQVVADNLSDQNIISPISSPDASTTSSEHTTPEDVSDVLSSLTSRKDSGSPDSLKSFLFETPATDLPDEHSRLTSEDSGSPDSLKFGRFDSPATDLPDESLISSIRNSRSPDSLKAYASETPNTDSPDESFRLSRRDLGSPDSLKSYAFETPAKDLLDESFRDTENLENQFQPSTPPRPISRAQSNNAPLTPSTKTRIAVSPSQNKANISPSYSASAEKIELSPSGTKSSGSTSAIVSPKDRKIAQENQENISELPSIGSLAEKLTRAGMESLPEVERKHNSQIPQNRIKSINIKSIR